MPDKGAISLVTSSVEVIKNSRNKPVMINRLFAAMKTVSDNRNKFRKFMREQFDDNMLDKIVRIARRHNYDSIIQVVQKTYGLSKVEVTFDELIRAGELPKKRGRKPKTVDISEKPDHSDKSNAGDKRTNMEDKPDNKYTCDNQSGKPVEKLDSYEEAILKIDEITGRVMGYLDDVVFPDLEYFYIKCLPMVYSEDKDEFVNEEAKKKVHQLLERVRDAIESINDVISDAEDCISSSKAMADKSVDSGKHKTTLFEDEDDKYDDEDDDMDFGYDDDMSEEIAEITDNDDYVADF